MNIYQFFIIASIKLLAIQIILFGIYLQFRDKAKLSNIIITVGSLIFAITGNALLFLFLNIQSSKTKGAKFYEQSNFNVSNKITSSFNHKCYARVPQKFSFRARYFRGESEIN